MLRVAIVGCGKIADAHASQIRRIPGCEIVGVCDSEPLMARQLFERFPVGAHFSDVNALIAEARPQVVHITTPPASHFDLARRCLERGCHVYVEKPFTLHAADAERLIALANRQGLKLTGAQMQRGIERLEASLELERRNHDRSNLITDRVDVYVRILHGLACNKVFGWAR